MTHLDSPLLHSLLSTTNAAPAITALIRWQGQTVFSEASGWLDPETRQRPVREDTLFDLASVSKLFTTIAFMRLVEAGYVALDHPVSSILPEFSGLRRICPYEDPLDWGGFVYPEPSTIETVDAGAVTFRNLLSHNAGLPAWRPLKDQPDAASARRVALETDFFYPTGSRVVYSDLGLILTGMAVEVLTGKRLDAAVQKQVAGPLGLAGTHYLPLDGQPYDTSNIAPTEVCAMRGRRICGEVHDENAWRLGGIAGHAGVFSTAPDLARFGQMLLEDGKPLLQPATMAEMTSMQAQDGSVRRGIGFMLRSDDPGSFTFCFSPRSFGHTGFTGTSLWIDPAYDLVVVLLTNRVYHGRDAAAITRLRYDFHQAVMEGVM